MSHDGFGSQLWKSIEAVRLGDDGGIEAPVRANGRDGIVVGRAAADNIKHGAADRPRRNGVLRRLWGRLSRRDADR